MKADEVLQFLKPKIAKWWMPDDMQVVKEIPTRRRARSTS